MPWSMKSQGKSSSARRSLRVKKSGLMGLSRKARVQPCSWAASEDIGHPAVAPGQQGLDGGPLGEIGVDPHRLDAVKLPGHQLQALFQLRHFQKRRPLEGGEGLGHEGRQAQGDEAQVFLAQACLDDGVLQKFRQAGDLGHVVHGLGGQAHHEVEAELADAGLGSRPPRPAPGRPG